MGKSANLLLLTCLIVGILFIVTLPGSDGSPAPDQETGDPAQVSSMDITEEDKRAWKNLQSAWGKRGWQELNGGWGKRAWQDMNAGWGKRGWQDMNSGWGKRGWNNLQAGWGKRSWDNFHGSWGKRMTSELPENQDVYEIDHFGNIVLMRNGQPILEQPEDYLNEIDNDDLIQKRSWKALNGAWGKRAEPKGNWGNFRGSWGKREPGWNNLKGLWGKRDNWNKISSAWGKRSDSMEDSDRFEE